MAARELAQFCRAIGNRIIQTESCYWYNPKPFLFKSLPIHRLGEPSPAEIAQVMIRGPAFAIRYPRTPDKSGPRGGMAVCPNPAYDFPARSQNVRSRTRRGLARCRIEQIDFDYLAQHGHALTAATTLRQMGTAPVATEEDWKLFCANASRSKDFEAWGAFVEDHLGTFIVAMLV